MASPTPNTQVLIAGGSIAGLTLANVLESAGIDYLVLEKYSKIGPDLGASIGILPNGARMLDQFGCWDRVIEKAKGADCFKSLQIRDSRGRLVTSLQDGSDHFNERYDWCCTLIAASDSPAQYSIPTEKSSKILLSILLGYVLPTLVMLSPIFPRRHLQSLVAGWQFTVLLVSAILHVTSKATPKHKPEVSANFRKYHEEDSPHLY